MTSRSQKLLLQDVQLNLSFIEPDIQRMQAFANWLGSDTQVTDLQLCFGHIKGEGTRFLADALRVNSGVRTLRLGGCSIHAAGMEHLATALRKNTTLHALGLSHNHLGPSGAEHLASALISNSVLQKLDLGSNQIGEHGAVFLANALKANHTLRALRLHGNVLRDVGAERIASALKENEGLLDLCLSCNCITDSGALYVAKALRQNSVLVRLDLSRNYIGENGADALVSALNGASLGMLCLANNPLGKPVDSWLSDSADEPRQATELTKSGKSPHHRDCMISVEHIASMLPRLDMNCLQSSPVNLSPSSKSQPEGYRPTPLRHHEPPIPLQKFGGSSHESQPKVSRNALEVWGSSIQDCSRTASPAKCIADVSTLEGAKVSLDMSPDKFRESTCSPLGEKATMTVINLSEMGMLPAETPGSPTRRPRPLSASRTSPTQVTPSHNRKVPAACPQLRNASRPRSGVASPPRRFRPGTALNGRPRAVQSGQRSEVARSSSAPCLLKKAEAREWFNKPGLHRPASAARLAQNAGSYSITAASYADPYLSMA